MKIAVIGTGYVGLVTGTCFADSGNDVTCVDIDQDKVDQLNRGEVPIYEPGLAELIQRNRSADRLHFTTNSSQAVRSADLVFLAVGTPSAHDGAADLTALWTVVKTMAADLRPEAVVVTKSTVPVGTNAGIFARLKELTGRECHVASNPEFLKEGAAIEDFMKPDRVVVGVRTPEVANILRDLYAPFLRTDKPFLAMSPESAEMTKYAANALLATKISFINEMSILSAKMGADIDDVRRGIGHDSRIGFAFLFPGVGYGGSCFPKDVRALGSMAANLGVDAKMMQAVDLINERQKGILPSLIENHFGAELKEKKIAVWGLAFKPRTDDIREAPALVLIDRLLAAGAQVAVHDPEAMENVQAEYADRLTYCERQLDALRGADALAILTEWGEFRHPDLREMHDLMNSPVVFDGRNIYGLDQMRQAGFTYFSIGRPAVLPA
ncbi:MAG: nucleotide sugar dehydrogenase [Planctomycetales bacterium]|nr:nucleotide sugar dehydrogenase [Planctomycetales bacterium]NIM09931.1 nucleotide sugar dehydrogenase [Planctomycetales bacterium]NIN09372.1 nucleotide sugar dehydrogenase [Planctomycetales bacterium]NIN78479.1 nucleotide sugar dehydrogenase [Planctomycetales bacterium]NIO35670.1 nucleotide sugar dehydrogenase [Planctomycetales bacterium]